MATIRDVAARANVHPSTVSRVFSGKAKISEETRERVLAAADLLNFQPNAIARSLSVSQSRTVGIIVPHVFDGYFEDSFFPQVMRGLLRVAYERDYRVIVSGSGSHADEINQIINLLGTRQADGIIALSNRLDVDTVDQLKETGAPFVLIGRPPSWANTIAWVDADNEFHTRQTIDYLLSLGHRRIAYVGGDPGVLVTGERLEGYKSALAGAGVSYTCQWVDYGYFAEDGGYQAARKMMALGGQAPSAFYAANDLMAIGVLRALRELGIQVPQEVSVVGTNNSAESARVAPALTTLDVPYATMAATAAALLIDSLEIGSLPGGSQMVSCQLMLRHSTAPVGN